ncbi:protein RCC2 homolog isoform X2 [Mastacembelus armatus]|uniref:protein RCC2 homolog isoform X2 n=1 Tax=Mastacembelus armatus TaxID=205130 RepID=UPI000E45F6C4|nr:protein RCC2 isoform X2 [Mastacembelus armatus]
MPRRKVTDISGNGGVKKKRVSGKRKERDFSSDDEFDFEQENNKNPGKPAAKSGLQPVTVADDVKEKIKLECPKVKGQLLIFGATNWDLIGRKEVPKQQAAFRNLGQNLWGPHRYGCLNDVQVSCVVSGPCAAHSLLMTTEGKLWSWGRNDKGQLGHGDTKRLEAPKLIEALGDHVIVAAACGRNHTLALTEDGTAYSFGENKLGQLGQGNQTDAVLSPAPISYNGQPLVKVACGAEFSMVVDCKGNLYSFGCPEYGQLGHNSDGRFIARAQRIEFDCELIPRRVAIFIEKSKDGQIMPVPNVVVRDVACGANHTLVLDSQKRVFSWGFGGYGRLGHTEQKDEMVPRLVKLFDFPGRGASQIYTGYQCSFAVSEMGEERAHHGHSLTLMGGCFSGVRQTPPENRPCTRKRCRICVDGRSAVWRVGRAASLLLRMRVQSAGGPHPHLGSWDMETTNLNPPPPPRRSRLWMASTLSRW